MDDTVCAENWPEVFTKLRKFLDKRFEISYGEKLTWYLSVHYEKSKDERFIVATQTAYIDRMVQKYSIVHPVKTPMEETFKIKIEDIPIRVDVKLKAEAQEKLGVLIHIAGWSRPDILFATIKLAAHAANPSKKIMDGINRVFRYLLGTKHLGIRFTNDEKHMFGLKRHELGTYVDASYGDDLISRKSTMGYFCVLNGGLVSWRSKHTPVVCTSTTDAEYIAACYAAMETMHLRQLLKALGFEQSKPTPLFEDNEACIALAGDSVFRERTKHIDIRFHYLRERVRDRDIQMIKIASAQQLANSLTKAEGAILFQLHRQLYMFDRRAVTGQATNEEEPAS